MIITLSFLLATANATDADTEALKDLVAEKQSELQIKEAALAAKEAELEKLKASCGMSPAKSAPKRSSKKSTPKPVVVDPRIAEMEAEIVFLREQLEKPIVVNVAAPVVTVTPVVEKTGVERTVSHEVGSHFIGYTGVGTIIAQPLPGFVDVVRGRLDLGARYSWDIGEGLDSAIYGEVGVESGGVDVRGLFGLILEAEGAADAIGLAAGVGYRCDAPGSQGCAANSTGLVIEGSLERAFGRGQAWGMLIRPGVEFNYASVPGPISGFESRGTLNFDFYFGRAQATTVTAH